MDSLDELIADVIRFVFCIDRDATQNDYALCSD